MMPHTLLSAAYPKSAYSGQKHFVLPPSAACCISQLPASCRNKGALRQLIMALGQHSMDALCDGKFHIDIINSLSLDVSRRTALKRQLPRLEESGAIVALGGGDYCILDFHMCNPPSEHVRAVTQRKQAYWRGRAALNRHRDVDNMSTSWQTEAQKNVMISKPEEKSPPAEPLQPTPPCADLSATNQASAALKVPEVDSPRDAQAPAMQAAYPAASLEPELAAILQRVQQKAAAQAQLAENVCRALPPMPPEEIDAVDMALLAAEKPQVLAKPKAEAREPAPYPTRLARLPKAQTSITQPAMEKALHDLQLRLSPQKTAQWWTDMRRQGASEQLLGYAVYGTRRQQQKQHIRDPQAYAQKIITAQLQARRAMLL